MALDVPAGRAVRVTSGGTGSPPRARYLPIAEHGLIGDLHTVALVGTDGTIDWYCCPRFDSPSVFAAILDADHGGLFRISPDCDGWSSKQLYLPDTNILITRFLMPDGVGEVQDFMPPPRTGEAARRHHMIRRVLAVRGQMRFVVDVAPRFDYARARHEVALTPDGALFRSPELALSLSARCPLEIIDGGGVRARIAVRAGETATFVLDRAEPGEAPVTPDAGIAARVRRHRGVLAGLAAPLALQRALARDGASLGAHAQTAHVRAHRRDRGRPHHQPAGRGRRRTQLGLPLHVDARRRLHALRAAPARVHRGGRRVHGLAGAALPPRGRPRVRPAADHVRRRRA